jgi:predicted HTH transcriptional regulator
MARRTAPVYATVIASGTRVASRWSSAQSFNSLFIRRTMTAPSCSRFGPLLTPRADRPRDELNDRQRAALDYVRAHGSITRREYAALTGVGWRQAANDLVALAGASILQRQGAGRSSRYVLKGA